MAATIYTPPKELPVPEYSDYSDWQAYAKAQDAYRAQLKEWVMRNGKGKYAGEELHFPVADGHATYFVYSLSPLKLIHDPTGDAWQFQYAHLMTAKEVKAQVESERRFQKAFADARARQQNG